MGRYIICHANIPFWVYNSPLTPKKISNVGLIDHRKEKYADIIFIKNVSQWTIVY